MPTILSHPAIPIAIGIGLGARLIGGPLLLAGVVASILPDLDVLAFRFGIPYAAAFGHRGFSHSLFFAAVFSLLVATAIPRFRTNHWISFCFLLLSIASHGILDTFTTGGEGIALLWPFSSQRFFAAHQVIEVAPLNPSHFLSVRGLTVMTSELQWIWLPAACVVILLTNLRFWHARQNSP